jgi:VWFA-related protein
MSVRNLSFLVFSLLLASPFLAGQSQSTAPSEQTPVIHATTREVILDLVVRDKHHHAVIDLRPEEVQVYEDGALQKIKVFRNVQGSEQLSIERATVRNSSSQPATIANKMELAHPLNSLRQVNFVSVVFAQIAPLNLEFARQAVNEFLKSDTLPNTYVTIYRLNPNLKVVQGYTGDTKSLAAAVDAATKGLYTSGLAQQAFVAGSVNSSIQAAEANILASPVSGVAAQNAIQQVAQNPLPTIVNDPLWARNAASQEASVVLGSALLTQATLENALRFSTSLVNGMDSMDSLRELVRSQEKLPGRKVVLYLADGLATPLNRQDVVQGLISYANRSGVSFYTVDTRGLNTEDPMMQSLAALNRAGAESSAQKVSPRIGHEEDDDVQLTAVSNSQLAMRDLAEQTGGFSVTNTNEISAPMQHIMEDIRTHYELAYAPASTNYDGHFRQIEVKVTRPKTYVQTRKGYFALPELNGEPLQPFELVALKAINANPAPVEFPYQVAIMKFRPRPEAIEYEVGFEIPVSGLKAATDANTGKARIQASVVALIHNSDGEIIGKVSRTLARDVDSPEIGHISTDHILYAEPVELPAGHYVVDTAVTDEQSGKTTVRKVSVFVDPKPRLGLSSLEVVGRFEPLPGPRNLSDPLEVEAGRIMPTFVQSVAAGKPVDLYFVVYPAPSDQNQDPKVFLQIFRDGKEVARKPLNLPRAGEDGSIPMLVRVSPDPGQCDIQITAQQGTLVAQSNLTMKIE